MITRTYTLTQTKPIGNIGIVNIDRIFAKNSPKNSTNTHLFLSHHNKWAATEKERDGTPGFTTSQRDNGDAIVESTPKLFLGHIKVLHL